jgi:glycerol-3-phosphate acyltransferase PlsY
VWLGFRGGKGMATALGVMIAASPLSGAAMCVVWLLVAKFFRFSSAATLASIAAGPFLVAMIAPDVSILILSFMVAGLVWARHGGNIRRLMTGTEPRIGER